MVRVLFVCMGNICRSPTAEGVFRKLVAERGYDELVTIDSAGTIGSHAGDPPDPRSQATARRFGVDISGQRARQVRRGDFEEFHYVVAMDTENMRILQRLCPSKLKPRLSLMCDFAPELGTCDVPDPYYGDGDGFERVFRMVERASEGLLATIEREHLSARERRG